MPPDQEIKLSQYQNQTLKKLLVAQPNYTRHVNKEMPDLLRLSFTNAPYID
jgi:hypothetical protein